MRYGIWPGGGSFFSATCRDPLEFGRQPSHKWPATPRCLQLVVVLSPTPEFAICAPPAGCRDPIDTRPNAAVARKRYDRWVVSVDENLVRLVCLQVTGEVWRREQLRFGMVDVGSAAHADQSAPLRREPRAGYDGLQYFSVPAAHQQAAKSCRTPDDLRAWSQHMVPHLTLYDALRSSCKSVVGTPRSARSHALAPQPTEQGEGGGRTQEEVGCAQQLGRPTTRRVQSYGNALLHFEGKGADDDSVAIPHGASFREGDFPRPFMITGQAAPTTEITSNAAVKAVDGFAALCASSLKVGKGRAQGRFVDSEVAAFLLSLMMPRLGNQALVRV